MTKNPCFFEKFSKLSISLVLFSFSVILAVSGFTVLPVFGIMIAVPFFLVALYFFRAHLSGTCQLE